MFWVQPNNYLDNLGMVAESHVHHAGCLSLDIGIQNRIFFGVRSQYNEMIVNLIFPLNNDFHRLKQAYANAMIQHSLKGG